MYIVQQTDISNCLRYLHFDHVTENLSNAVQYMINEVLSLTPNDCCWIDLHDGKFYYQTSTTPEYTMYNTLFDQRQSGDYPDTWEALQKYLETHSVDLGWSDRGCTVFEIVEMSSAEIAKSKATVDPKYGNVRLDNSN